MAIRKAANYLAMMPRLTISFVAASNTAVVYYGNPPTSVWPCGVMQSTELSSYQY